MEKFFEDAMVWFAKALGFYTPPPAPKRLEKKPPIIGSAQKKRAKKRLKNLTSEDRAKYDSIAGKVKSPQEEDYLLKAVASNYPMDEVVAFAEKIRGKDEAWMQNNLKLTGSTEGKGVKQQWSHSCNATTVQAIRGQLDPIYALKLHEENADITAADDSNATKTNAKLAEEQRKMLTSTYSGSASAAHAGTAVARNAAGGSGRWADDLMNDISDVTGVKYSNKLIDDVNYKVADAMKDVEKGAKVGHPVPIVIGNSLGAYTHYVLVTGLTKESGKAWVIHDPWDGVTVSRLTADIKASKVNVANCSRLTALDVPATKK